MPNTETLEVVRVCTDGIPNARSFLYRPVKRPYLAQPVTLLSACFVAA
jgi:hypothetical protein